MSRSATARAQYGTWLPLRVVACALFLAASCRNPAESSGDRPPAVENTRAERAPPHGVLVAHALGAIHGMTYTNSLEALRCNHARGFRWFEVDLTLTLDQQLVAFHTKHERRASLQKPIAQLAFSDVQGARYGGKFPIPRFSDVLNEARSLGDAVLVLDTKSWDDDMLSAVQRTLAPSFVGGSNPRVVFQSYGEKDIEAVARLARSCGAELILTLYQTRATDQDVVRMAKEHGAIAIVATPQRFTPWLAERLHAERIPILVHTVNEHEQVAALTRAGADGFYTDTYVPYERMTADRRNLLECGATQPSPRDLLPWLERNLATKSDYQTSTCVVRRDGRVELEGCDSKPAITGLGLAVPPGGEVHVELEAEAPAAGSAFWFQVLWKDGTKPQRPERIQLAPNERRTFTRDAVLASGSPGVAARLGMSAANSGLIIHRLLVALKPGPTSGTVSDGSLDGG